MSYSIVKNFIPGLAQEAYDGGVGAYIGVVAHATANNGDSADSERSYESKTWQSAFVHFFVDDQKIEQVADTNYVCYGAGHTANHSGYAQVELCQSTDATKFANAYAQYVWLLAYLLYQKKLGVTDGVTLMSHAQVSAKWKETDHTDPIEYLASHGKTWANVVADVTAQYQQLEVNDTITSVDHVVITTKAGLNLRAGYNTTAKVLAVIPYNTTCIVVGSEPGWYEVQYNGNQGWVSSEYVTFTPKVTPTAPLNYETETIRVIVDGKQVTALTGITKATDYSKATYPGKTVSLICVADNKTWTVVVPAVTVASAPVIAPNVTSAVTNAPVVTASPAADPTVATITSVLTDPANVPVLKQMYNFLNKIYGGK